MNSGIFSHKKTFLKHFSKLFLFLIFFSFILLSNIKISYADSNSAPFVYLFNTEAGPQLNMGINTSNLTYSGSIPDKKSETVPGLWFKFSFSFENAEYTWDHIKDPSTEETFLLKSCDTDNLNNCLYSIVPYYEDVGSKTGFFGSIADFWFKWNPVGIVTTAVTGLTVNNTTDNYLKADTIFQKDSDGSLIKNPLLAIFIEGSYIKKLSVDIKSNIWLDKNHSEQIVDWVKKPDQNVSIWYCAKNPTKKGPDSAGGHINPSTITEDSNENMQKFGTKYCGNNWYFKISEALSKKPNSFKEAESLYSEIKSTTPNEVGEKSNLPACGLTNGTVIGCVAQVVYYLIYVPIAWFAGIMGSLFDYFLGYSLSDESYRASFAVEGWKLVRDISNVFFIIILVYTGFATALGIGKVSMRSVVPTLIMNALLINFSLFGTRAVIDLSNIVARVFYNQISVCSGTCEDGAEKKHTDQGYTPLSERIVQSFNPQKLFNQDVLDSQQSTPSVGTKASVGEKNTTTRSESETAGYYIIVTLIASLILFGVAMMFWKTAFFFLGRVVGLYIAMIFAPFAVLTFGNMPIVSSIKELAWDNWLKDLTNYALLAPIFVFFLYIIFSLISTGSGFFEIKNADINNSDFFQNVISITVPLLIVYFMIKQGVGIAEEYAGKIGKGFQDAAMKVVGVGAGIATGGAALMGGRVIGAGANALKNSSYGSKLRDSAANKGISGWVARNSLKGINKASGGSYDLRKTALGGGVFKSMGLNANPDGLNALKGVGLGLGEDQRKGGYESDVKRRKERQLANAKLLEETMSKEQIEAYNTKKKAGYNKEIEKVADEAMFRSGKTMEQITTLKTTDYDTYKKERDAILVSDLDAKKEYGLITKPKEMLGSKEVTKARKEKFSKGLLSNKKFGILTGIRDKGNKEASDTLDKEITKLDAESKNTKRAEDLSKDLGAKLTGLESELKNATETYSKFISDEAAKYDEFRDANLDLEEVQKQIIEKTANIASGELAVLGASLEKAKDVFKNASSKQDKENSAKRLAKAKLAFINGEKNVSSGQNLLNKKNSILDTQTKTVEKKIQVDNSIESKEYRKSNTEKKTKDTKEDKSKEK